MSTLPPLVTQVVTSPPPTPGGYDPKAGSLQDYKQAYAIPTVVPVAMVPAAAGGASQQRGMNSVEIGVTAVAIAIAIVTLCILFSLAKR